MDTHVNSAVLSVKGMCAAIEATLAAEPEHAAARAAERAQRITANSVARRKHLEDKLARRRAVCPLLLSRELFGTSHVRVCVCVCV